MGLPGKNTRLLPRAFTLVEVMIASAVLVLLGLILVSLTIFTTRSFIALGNYADLDAISRNSLDHISRELRESAVLLEADSNPTAPYLLLTNEVERTSITIRYLPDREELLMDKPGEPTRVLLTGCDRWSFQLFTRAPTITSTNILFNRAKSLSGCKLINMSWKCSRKILGQKVNTESVQTAQIVLRNKVR